MIIKRVCPRTDEVTEHNYISVLSALSAAKVFEISKKDNNFRLVESCDYFFDIELTPELLKTLGEELIEMSKQ